MANTGHARADDHVLSPTSFVRGRVEQILKDCDGLAMSKRRITLSTSGVVPLIERVGSDLGINLAISLHAVTDELRNRLVPINKTYPLGPLLEACRCARRRSRRNAQTQQDANDLGVSIALRLLFQPVPRSVQLAQDYL